MSTGLELRLVRDMFCQLLDDGRGEKTWDEWRQTIQDNFLIAIDKASMFDHFYPDMLEVNVHSRSSMGNIKVNFADGREWKFEFYRDYLTISDGSIRGMMFKY